MRQLFPRLPVIAVTATATADVRRSIIGARQRLHPPCHTACTAWEGRLGASQAASRPLPGCCIQPVPRRTWKSWTARRPVSAELLALKSPVQLLGGFNRPNIGYEVRLKELIGIGSQAAVFQVQACTAVPWRQCDIKCVQL